MDYITDLVQHVKAKYRDPGRLSDHRIAFANATLPRIRTFKRLSYTYRFMDPERVEDFGRWLVGVPWDEVFQVTGSNGKADAYEATLNAGVAEFFPLITTRRKDTDPPWINATARWKICLLYTSDAADE